MRPEPSLRHAVIAALSSGPLSRDSLRAALGAPWTAHGDGRDELDRLLQHDMALTELSAGVVSVPTLLDGTRWCVHVDATDAEAGFVRLHPHLDPLGWWLIGDDVPLLGASGEPLGMLDTDGIDLDGRDTDVVVGPAGWLDAHRGAWAAFEVVDGGVRVTPLDDVPTATTEQAAAIRAGYERALEQWRSTKDSTLIGPDQGDAASDAAVHEAVLAHPAELVGVTIPPLPALFEAAGLEVRNGIVVPAGFDWDAFDARGRRSLVKLIHHLDDATADAVTALGDAARASSGGEIDVRPARAWSSELLADEAPAVACWYELATVNMPPARLRQFVDELLPEHDRSIGAAWLRARAAERAGDTVAALDILAAAVTGTTQHRPALVDLAGYRADQGDAAAAHRLLQRAGVEDDDDDSDDGSATTMSGRRLSREIAEFAQHRPRPTAGRNDPCPCGSGRKYKACHLGRETHPMADRAVWLYWKAVRYVRDHRAGDFGGLVETVADTASVPWTERRHLADLPLLVDVALHESEAMAEFLASRSALLPDDEALLAAQWQLVDRSVFEVERAGGTWLDVRDVRTGERHRIVNVTVGPNARPGALLLGRPLPVGDTMRAMSGFLTLAPVHVDQVMAALDDGDPYEIAEGIGAVLAPPRLANTDGDELVWLTARWRIPDPEAVGAALVADGFHEDGDGTWTLVRDSRNQANTLIASLRLDGEHLVVEVNSEERYDEVRERVRQVLPDAEFVSVTEHEVDPSAAGAVPRPNLENPEVREALATLVANFEERWLDESIPALDGRTPREAAADPIGREQLIQLLASFPAPTPDDVGAMDPDRLRAALDV